MNPHDYDWMNDERYRIDRPKGVSKAMKALFLAAFLATLFIGFVALGV